jgi:hypothetical protein
VAAVETFRDRLGCRDLVASYFECLEQGIEDSECSVSDARAGSERRAAGTRNDEGAVLVGLLGTKQSQEHLHGDVGLR